MTEPVHAGVPDNDPTIVRRPRRQLGARLRRHLCCPLCRQRLLRIVKFREHTCRLECLACRLRFTIHPAAVAAGLLDHAEAIVGPAADENRQAWQIDNVRYFGQLLADEIAKVASAINEGR